MSKKLLPPITDTNSLVVYQTPKLHSIKKKRCSYCQETGHNAATCYHRNRCSECGEKGHNIRTCPDVVTVTLTLRSDEADACRIALQEYIVERLEIDLLDKDEVAMLESIVAKIKSQLGR